MSMFPSLYNILLLLSRIKHQRTFKVTSLAFSVCFQPDCICATWMFPDTLHLPCSCITGWALTSRALLQQTNLSWPQPWLCFWGLLPATSPPFCCSHFPRLLLRYFFTLLDICWMLTQDFAHSTRWRVNMARTTCPHIHMGAGKSPQLSHL